MSDTVIKVENLSKQYRLGLVGTGTLSHDLNRWWHRMRGKEDPYLKVTAVNDRTKARGENKTLKHENGKKPHPSSDYVWALEDINLEVKQGEVLGIIGRNGAGKSTLLKILSRITAPTTGQIKIKGRTASLLEVGTGFHQELTGRENIYLNGAIMGMTKAEVTSKLEEIVDFSGCERYIDTPVKRYSSGMMVRLGFAVAAHLEPEILVVDEVLAVGDAEFQKKCIGKMKDVAGHGRTVLFVSHNMAAVEALCSSAILFSQGTLRSVGSTQDMIEKYIGSIQELSSCSLEHRTDRTGNGRGKLVDAFVAGPDGNRTHEICTGSVGQLVLHYRIAEPAPNLTFRITVYSNRGKPLTHFDSSLVNQTSKHYPPEGYVSCCFDSLPLSRGTYWINASISSDGVVLDHVLNALSFAVHDGDFFGTGKTIVGLSGICLVEHHWKQSPSMPN